MKLFLSFLMVSVITGVYAQVKKPDTVAHYFSVRPEVVAPLGFFNNMYRSGLGINALMHFNWLKKGAEVQLITGYERFKPKKDNVFGDITAIPLKMGLQQMISKQFYLYGRAGVLAVKDGKTNFDIRFSTDAGVGFAFKKIAVDIGVHGWLRKSSGGFTNYFSAGLVLPFRRLN